MNAMQQSINKESLLRSMRESKNHSMRIQVCASVFEQIEQQTMEERANTFQWFVEQAQEEWCYAKEQEERPEISELLQQMGVPTATEKKSQAQTEQNELFISNREISIFNAKYRQLIESVINMLSLDGLKTNDYYNALFDILLKLCSEKTAAEKGLCLYNVIWDDRSPYYEVKKGVALSESEYRDVLKIIEPQLRKMTFVLNLSHSQRTEEASQLLNLIDELETREMKTVFLAQLLKTSRKKDEQ